MKKKISSRFLSGLVVLSLLGKPSLAAGEIGLAINGKNISIPSGQEAFIENGQTYLPIKLVATSLGRDVKWDSKNRAVYIGEKPSLNMGEILSLEDFIREYNVYSSGEDYGEYLEGFKELEEKYKNNQNIEVELAGKKLNLKNINLEDEIYPVYNEIAKVKFSLAFSKEPVRLNGEEIKLDGGAPRVKALVRDGENYRLKNLVAKMDYQVDEKTPNHIEEFEMKLKDVYGLGLPENALNVEFYRNTDKIRIYIDGEKFQGTDKLGRAIEPINRGGRIYLPIRSLGEAFGKHISWDSKSRTVNIRDLANEKRGLSPREVFLSHGSGPYEKKIGAGIQKDKVYMYNPRNKTSKKLLNTVHIPDGTLSLNKEFKSLRGYHGVGIGTFLGDGPGAKSLANKFNTGLITSGERVIYDANRYFKETGTGELIDLKPESARLKKYMPGNIVYFEIDLEGLDEISFNNFNAFDLEFVK